MTDTVKNLIWDLVDPQLEAYNRTGATVERTLLEHKVLDVIQTIEEQEEATVLNAFHDGFKDGTAAAEEQVDDMRAEMRKVIEGLKNVVWTLENGYDL